MTKLIGTLLAIFGAFSLIVGIFFYGIWAAAFVGLKLWTWFIVPVFVGMPTLTLTQTFGISLLIGYWTKSHSNYNGKDERTDRQKSQAIIGVLFYPWLVLLLGWIARSWFM